MVAKITSFSQARSQGKHVSGKGDYRIQQRGNIRLLHQSFPRNPSLQFSIQTPNPIPNRSIKSVGGSVQLPRVRSWVGCAVTGEIKYVCAGSLITNHMENISQVIKEETQAMDCEGFQDLNQWCSAKSTASPQTPSHIDTNYGICYIEEPLENKNNEEVCFDNWFVGDIGVKDKEESFDIFRDTHENYMINNIDDNAQMNGVVNENGMIVFVNDQNNEEVIELSNDSDKPRYFTNEANDGCLKSVSDYFTNMFEENETMEAYRKDIKTQEVMNLTNGDIMFTSSYNYENHFSNNFPTSDMTQRPTLQYNTQSLQGNENIKNDNTGLSSSTKANENNDALVNAIIHEYTPLDCHIPIHSTGDMLMPIKTPAHNLKLKINSSLNAWNNQTAINTPDILSTVEQLENERQSRNVSPTIYIKPESPSEQSIHQSHENTVTDSTIDFTPPDTPKKPEKKRRRESEDSDVTYIPDHEYKPVPKKQKKNSSPPRISYITRKFLEQLNTPSRRGRPPKRRESVSSSGTCNFDDSHSVISSENKYRDQRDRNNEASRRSRFNRKVKDVEMSQTASELEERNKYLRKHSDRLLRKRDLLKEFFFNAIRNNNNISMPFK